MLQQPQILLALLQFVAAVAVAGAFVLWRGLDVATLLLANLVACALLVASNAAAGAVAHGHWTRRLRRFGPALGILLAPAAFTGWAVEQAAPLRAWPDLLAVLRYALPFTVLLALQAAVSLPRLSPPASESPVAGERCGRIFTYLILCLAFALMAIALLSRFAAWSLEGWIDEDAALVVPILSLAYALNAVHCALVPSLNRSARPALASRLAVLAALLGVVLHLVLVPLGGALGAALATLVTFLALAGATVVAAQRAFPIPFEHARLVKIACAAGIVYLAVLRWPATHEWSMLAAYLTTALLAFPIVLSLSGFLRPHERQALRRLASLNNA